jgi:hypothetical protein
VCRISILWKIGDVHEKVYARLPSLQRLYQRGKNDLQPDPHQAFGLPPSSRVDFLSTTGDILKPAALSPHIKHLQLRCFYFPENGPQVTLPSVERLDVLTFKGRPFRSAHLPCVRVLTLHLFYGLAMLVDWLNDGPILQYPSLEAVMFKGPADWWEGPRWSAHDFMSFVIRLWKDAIPRLKYVHTIIRELGMTTFQVDSLFLALAMMCGDAQSVSYPSLLFLSGTLYSNQRTSTSPLSWTAAASAVSTAGASILGGWATWRGGALCGRFHKW